MNNIAVIMCVWDRIEERLARTLDMLSVQKDKGFEFFIWNNNFNKKGVVESICKNHKFNVTSIRSSEENVGGIGRFYLAREISDQFEFVLFIDDDIDFDKNTISIVKQNLDENSIKSWWSWRINGDDYWNRERILTTSVQVDYCGTAMMSCPINVFKDKRLYDLLPSKYSFVEDLWLSHFVRKYMNYRCEFLPVSAKLILDGKDQSLTSALASGENKRSFYKLLKNTLKTQVYGLPRSGTNFLEWSLVNYFDNFGYRNRYKTNDVTGTKKFNIVDSLKHSYPNLQYSDTCIVIYKDFPKWSKSYKKWARQEASRESWEKYLERARSLPQDKVIIISHEELYSKYKKTLQMISDKTGIKLLKKQIIKPDGYMNKDGANSRPLNNKKYKH